MRTYPNAQITRRIQPKQRTTQQAHRRSLSPNRTAPHAYRIHRNFRSRKSKHPSRSPSSALPGLPATRTRSASPSETNTFFASPPSGSPGRRIRRLASGAPLPPTLNLLHSRSAWAQVLLTRLLHRRAGVWRGRGRACGRPQQRVPLERLSRRARRARAVAPWLSFRFMAVDPDRHSAQSVCRGRLFGSARGRGCT